MTRTDYRKKIHIIVTLVFFFGILGWYAYGRAYNLIFGPQIEIISPLTGQLFDTDLIAIAGNTKNTAAIFLNDRQIFPDDSGTFHEDFLLHFGYNSIEVLAKDRFGKEKIEAVEVVFQ